MTRPRRSSIDQKIAKPTIIMPISASPFRRSSTFTVVILFSLCAVGLLWNSRNQSPKIGAFAYADREAEVLGFRPTRVLAHAPGYTVFENVYWQDGTVRCFNGSTRSTRIYVECIHD